MRYKSYYLIIAKKSSIRPRPAVFVRQISSSNIGMILIAINQTTATHYSIVEEDS